MWKKAAREKLRFSTPKGSLSAEQLWDLSLTNLSEAIKSVNAKITGGKADDNLSFLDSNNNVDPSELLRFEILKDVYVTKKSENAAALDARKKKEHNQKILTLIEEKKEESLKGKSVEELESLLIN